MRQNHHLKRGIIILWSGIILMLLTCIRVTPAWSIPQVISYQGLLKDANGDRVTGTVNMTFRMFNVETGGSSLWTEVHSIVPLVDGIYHVELGSITPFPANIFSEDTRWLEVEVEGEIFDPRIKFVSMAYSFQAAIADDVYDKDMVLLPIMAGGTRCSIILFHC